MTLSIDPRADHYAETTAVIDHTTGTEQSYEELERRTTEVAVRLAGLDVGRGDPVVVLSKNRPLHLELFFALERLGGVLAPVSHRLTAGEIDAIVGTIDPSLIIYETAFEAIVPSGRRARTVETFREAIDDAAVPLDRPDATSEGAGSEAEPLMYLHTGGTTGTPKVVVLPRRQIEWNCITEIAAWGLGNDDVSPILLPMFHTGGWNLLTLSTLYVGGTVVLQRSFDPGEALSMIETYGGTHVFGVAAIFEAMATHDAFELTEFSSVEWFMSGGGPTPEAVMDAYRDRGETFTQGYGLTEGGPNNLYMDARRPDAADKPDSVGRPFPDCSIRIVDGNGDPVDRGETGELEVSGPVTAAGYLETEDGTFGGKWVSTGDLARRDGDGDVYITGRVDNMFVSGGENVYPEEIEDVLARHPSIDDVAVVGVPHDRWGTVPKAVVVGSIDREAVESYAEEVLAGFKRPRAIDIVTSLPRSGPGKLDRDALEREFGDPNNTDEPEGSA